MISILWPKKSARHQTRALCLRDRLMLPFLVTLVVLVLMSAIGAYGLYKKTITLSVDERLQAAREIVYREFKKQESILQTYTIFLQQFQNLLNLYPGEIETDILQRELFNTLAEAEISVSFFPAVSEVTSQDDALLPFLQQARRSKSARFRYMKDLSGLPVLMVAAPLYEDQQLSQIMLLQTTMGGAFLKEVTTPLGIEASLHDLNGAILAESTQHTSPLQLKETQLVSLSRGEQLFLDHLGGSLHRHLFSAIPLGTSDLVFLSLEAELDRNRAATATFFMQVTGGLLLAIMLGLGLYLKAVKSILQPIKMIQRSVDAINQGNLRCRIELNTSGELALLADTVNQVFTRLDEADKARPVAAPDDALVHEQTRTRLLLEKKEQELTKLTEDFRAHQRETAAILQLNQAMIASPDLNILFERILQVLHDVLNCDHIVLLLHNPGENVLEVAHALGIGDATLNDTVFSFDQGFCGKVAQEKRLLYVGDVEQDERHLSYHGQLATRGSIVSAPLLVHKRLIGVLNLHKHDINAFSASELKLTQAAANQAAIAIDNAQLLERSKDMANYDPLTGLHNRRFFQDVLKREAAQARRFKTLFSTIMCDIDRFNQFCSIHGKMRGEALLKDVAQVLLRTTRGIDLVCRFGNRQFVVLLPKTDKTGAALTAEKLRLAIFNETFSGEAESQPEGRLTMSFGVTEFPADSQNIYELLNLADRALYHAKQQGRNRTVAWDNKLEREEMPES